MRIRMSIDSARLRGTGSRPHTVDVLVDASDGTTFEQVRSGLARAAGLPDATDRLTFVTEGRAIPPRALLGEPPLVQGALIHVVSHATRPTPTYPSTASPAAALLHLHIVSGPGAGRAIPLGRGTHLIGRSAGCTIRLEDRGVSRVHIELDVSADGVTARDLEPTNPSRLQGEPLKGSAAVLALPDNEDRLRLGSTTVVIRRAERAPAQTTTGQGMVRVHRPPRFRDASSPVTLTFPSAPAKPQDQRVPLITSLIPLLLAGGLAYATASPMMLLFGLMSPVMLLGQWLSDRRHGRISHRQALVQQRASVEELRREVAAALRREGNDRRAASPDLGIVGHVASTPESSLWQRRPGDDDHLLVRVGIGTQPSRIRLEGAVPPDLLGAVVDEVPVLVDLAAAGVLGISGPRARVLSQAASLLLQIATWQSPKDVRVVIFTSSPSPEPDWEWASRLPHAQPTAPDTRLASVVSASDESATRRIVSELQCASHERRSAHPPGAAASTPSFVVILDGAHDLRKLPGMAELLSGSPPTGILWICLDEVAERLPAETTCHVALDTASAPRATVRGSARVDEDVIPDLPTRAWVEQVARALAPLEDATTDSDTNTLPAEVGFRALHQTSPLALDPADPAMLARHWSSPGRSRTALLGRSAAGPYAVDLIAAGPHALVGGTTGAGKSELLQTLVAGLAVAHHPEELAFVLVDYKGGSAFKDCARLPHTLGVVTDLDEHLSARALTSLGAELKRRERILAEHGAKDLEDYARRRSAPSPLLPRLVLVVDEFKMLADELPHFVDGLVRLAAVGRSLGVHLVLATQRPGGIVSGDMRANIALRIALRVRDRSDSMDVVESPEAAAISDRFPGRALVRSADLDLHEIQTAYAGGPVTRAKDSRRRVPTVRPLDWSELADEPPRPPAREAPDDPGAPTELAAVADAAVAAAQALGHRPIASPWLPALPDRLPAAALRHNPDTPDLVSFGLADRPAEQRQDTYSWDLASGGHLALVGGARTGRSTALRTIALALAVSRPPSAVHLHVLEGSPGHLRHLGALPHVGSVVGLDDPRRARRVVARLLDEVAARRSSPTTTAPRMVLLLDGWEAIEDAFESIDHGEPTEELLRLLRDGLSAGIAVAVTGGRALTGGRLSSLLQQRLILGLSDPLDLTLAGVSPDAVPVRQGPGRAVEPREGCEVQIAFHGLSPEREAQDAVVAEVAAALSAAHADLPQLSLPWQIHPLPERVPLDGLPATSATDLVIGVGGDSLEPLGFDPSLDGRRLLVAGPARSGRSTALLCLAQQVLQHARPLAVITPRRSPLTELGGIPGVHVFRPEDAEGFIALRRDLPDLAVLVDDADGLEGAPIESALLETTRLVDAAEGLVAISVDLHRGTALFRGLVPEVARHATGLLLGARSPADGELFRMRVDPLTDRHPGRGLHVVEGIATPLQVAVPDVLTATRALQHAAKTPTTLAAILDPTTAAEDGWRHEQV